MGEDIEKWFVKIEARQRKGMGITPQWGGTCTCLFWWFLCAAEVKKKKSINLYIAINWRRQWQPTPVLLPGESHGWRSLVGCSSWGHEESDVAKWLHFHFSLSCTGEGNGNPLQYSCLENPRDRGAWWAAVCGVAQSRTWLTRLSSSSSKLNIEADVRA